jgi:hypothetical protein
MGNAVNRESGGGGDRTPPQGIDRSPPSFRDHGVEGDVKDGDAYEDEHDSAVSVAPDAGDSNRGSTDKSDDDDANDDYRDYDPDLDADGCRDEDVGNAASDKSPGIAKARGKYGVFSDISSGVASGNFDSMKSGLRAAALQPGDNGETLNWLAGSGNSSYRFKHCGSHGDDNGPCSVMMNIYVRRVHAIQQHGRVHISRA